MVTSCCLNECINPDPGRGAPFDNDDDDHELIKP